MSNNTKNKQEEYSITGFSDLIASPMLLAIIILTFILGGFSIFGFFQNPQKLRLIIDLISRRVEISEATDHHPDEVAINHVYNKLLPINTDGLHTVSQKNGYITSSSLDELRYSILSDNFSLENPQKTANKMELVLSLNYDITSKEFLYDRSEEIQIEQDWSLLQGIQSRIPIIGTPLSPNYSLGYLYQLGIPSG